MEQWDTICCIEDEKKKQMLTTYCDVDYVRDLDNKSHRLKVP